MAGFAKRHHAIELERSASGKIGYVSYSRNGEATVGAEGSGDCSERTEEWVRNDDDGRFSVNAREWAGVDDAKGGRRRSKMTSRTPSNQKAPGKRV